MALIRRIPGATRVLGKTQGYLGLPVRDAEIDVMVGEEKVRAPSMTTAWELTPDEIDRINRGASVHVTILGESHPPIHITIGDPPE